MTTFGCKCKSVKLPTVFFCSVGFRIGHHLCCRWSNTSAGEEWRGGWGNTQQQQEQGPSSGANKQPDDNSRWGSDQYGNNYGQSYSYGAGYTNPGDEAHER